MSIRLRLSKSAAAFAAVFGATAGLTTVTGAWAYHTHFVADNCTLSSNPAVSSSYTRDNATHTAAIAMFEGYQWNGGCWNDDNVDNSPGDPKQDPNTGGEGPDCSGLVWKVWRERDQFSGGGIGFYFWPRWYFRHGPYYTWNFKSGDGDPNVTYPKSGLIKMDAFVSLNHMGLMYSNVDRGSDAVIEAKGEDYGTNLWIRSYRADTNYSGARRLGWTG